MVSSNESSVYQFNVQIREKVQQEEKVSEDGEISLQVIKNLDEQK